MVYYVCTNKERNEEVEENKLNNTKAVKKLPYLKSSVIKKMQQLAAFMPCSTQAEWQVYT